MLKKTNKIIVPSDKTFIPLWGSLNNKSSDTERIRSISEFLQSAVRQQYNPDKIDIIYDNIAENILNFSLQDTYKCSTQSCSSLQRNFKMRVGVSMKKLMRISRVYHIFNNMLYAGCFNSQDLMVYGNYYDQSHFIKDFKGLTGQSPKHFFRHNTELCRIFSGMHKENYNKSN